MKKKFLIAIAIFICIIGIILGIYFIAQNSNLDKYALENIHNEYLNADEKVVATVNNVDITNKELCLIQYSSHTNKPLEKAIEQKAIIQLAEDDGFSLSKADKNKEIDYITNQYEKLNLPDNEENNAFCEDLKKEHLDMSTAVQYQYEIQQQILRQSFKCDNDDINKKYEKYKEVYKEWVDGGKDSSRLYSKVWSLREEIAQDYIDYRTENFQIEKY